MRHQALGVLALLVSGCDGDPQPAATPGESRVTAEAVADVDAAMADARRVPPPAAAPPASQQAATTPAP